MNMRNLVLVSVILLLTLACITGEGMGGAPLPPDEDFGVPLPPNYDYGVFCFFELEDGIVAKAPVFETFFSSDGGLTWQPKRFDHFGIASQFEDVNISGSACSFDKKNHLELWVEPDGQTRYHFYPGERIEVSVDSGQSWEVTFDLSSVDWEPAYSPDPEREMIVRPGPSDAMIDRKTGNLLLAMGHAGVLVRLPSGEWQWVEVGQYGYSDSDSTPVSQETSKEETHLPAWIRVSPDIEIDTQNINVYTLIFSPDSQTLAASGAIGGVQFYAFPAGDLIHWLQCGEEAKFRGLYGAAFSDDGETLVTCGTVEDRSLRLWDVESKVLINEFRGYMTKALGTGAYNGDQFLAIAVGETWYALDTVRLFHLPDGLVEHSFNIQAGYVTYIRFIPGTSYLAVGKDSGNVDVLDFLTGEHIYFLKPDKQPTDRELGRPHVSALGYDPSKNVLLVLQGNGRLHAYDLSTGETAWQLALPILHGWYFSSSAFSEDGRLVAVGMPNGVLQIFDSNSGALLTRYWIPDGGEYMSLAFSPDNQWFAAGFISGKVRAWQVKDLIDQN